ncbi:unnamed protein product [Brassicogethes aeneus]|uniref:Major facilitator superfamily (MFS) profile domain-containing protein n=1 Tax=Brassicogethes aeneus TaxID=1431903 RepID=A0A9P0FLY9_BRAAE|nr:unnamed protein product [Brassicogethes aeneus]
MTSSKKLPIVVLFFGNLLTYMNRFAITGVLGDLELHLELKEDDIGLMQTFYIVVMIFGSPPIGYFGDKFSKKWVLTSTTLLWIITSAVASFVCHSFWIFVSLRALSGVGEAGFIAVAPALISDYYDVPDRHKMLAIFYLAYPFGAGLGYIVGGEAANKFGNWRWGMRIVPCFGVLILVMLCFLKNNQIKVKTALPSNWRHNLGMILKNKTFMLTMVGCTCMAYIAGPSGWWTPKIISLGLQLQQKAAHTTKYSLVVFGMLVILSGILGILFGYILSKYLGAKFVRADPIMCGVGMLMSAPFIASSFYLVLYSTTLCYLMGFMGFTMLNLQPAVVSSIILSVISPNNRGLAQGVLLFFCHTFGDCISPYIFGLTTQYFRLLFEIKGEFTYINQFNGFLCSIFMLCMVDVLGGVMFFICSLYIKQDREQVNIDQIKAPQEVTIKENKVEEDILHLT